MHAMRLHVAHPENPGGCNGSYSLALDANGPDGLPLWQQLVGNNFIFSGTSGADSGRWCIGDQSKRDRHWLLSERQNWPFSSIHPHKGLPPQHVTEWYQFGFHDSFVRITAPVGIPMQVAVVRATSGNHILDAHVMSSDTVADVSAQIKAALASALPPFSDIHLLHGDKVLGEEAQHRNLEDLGIVASPQLQLVQEGIPQRLRLSYPENPGGCSGTYSLRVGVNGPDGLPVWQQLAEEDGDDGLPVWRDNFIFSGTSGANSGRWCIGDQSKRDRHWLLSERQSWPLSSIHPHNGLPPQRVTEWYRFGNPVPDGELAITHERGVN